MITFARYIRVKFVSYIEFLTFPFAFKTDIA